MSIPFISNLRKLKNHWLSHDVKVNAGVSEASLAAFEDKFNVFLPSDLYDYFRTMNGMAQDVTDDDSIRFWMLEEITTLPTGASDYASRNYIDNPESLFLFADYSLWAHAYAIRLFPHSRLRNDIFIVGGDYPILLFRSFGELIDSYLNNKQLMFSQSSPQ